MGPRTYGRGMMQTHTWKMHPGPSHRWVTALEMVNIVGYILLRAGDGGDPSTLEECSKEKLPRWQPEGCSHGAQKMYGS